MLSDKYAPTQGDHPRLRGEHQGYTAVAQPKKGSPPPTRGTQELVNNGRKTKRITPAYAGNTDANLTYTGAIWDHPRLRGEHDEYNENEPLCRGSPPPTRGTLGYFNIVVPANRITPAYAGNTKIIKLNRGAILDHPRLRGEHDTVLHSCLLMAGSPPPTRGTLSKYSIIFTALRITPAYAGNTCCRIVKIKSAEDHPRLRGEHVNFELDDKTNIGSPPPTRGTLVK